MSCTVALIAAAVGAVVAVRLRLSPIVGYIVAGILIGPYTPGGRSARTSILVGATLAQSAEFSFLIARVGSDIGAVGNQAFSLMLGAAAVSVVLSPAVVEIGHRLGRRVDRLGASDEVVPARPEVRRRDAVLCGHGRVGRLVAQALDRRGFPVRRHRGGPAYRRGASVA